MFSWPKAKDNPLSRVTNKNFVEGFSINILD